MRKIMEIVPNYSEGRRSEVVEKIVDCFRNKPHIKLLNYSSDKDHNRTVVTVVGEPESLIGPIIESVKVALINIDLRKHSGEHPRMGALDVCPFIPVSGMTMAEAVELSKRVAEEIGKLNIPVFLYEKSATASHRENLAGIRKGQFEGMAQKMTDELWQADFGPANAPHASFGVTAVGARLPLIAFNANLNTASFETADAIARRIRYIGGGLRFVKAMGVEIKEKRIAQVSVNLTDYTKTHLYQVLEMIKFEARRYGVSVTGTEIVGLVPLDALTDTAEYYLGLENFENSQVLELRIME